MSIATRRLLLRILLTVLLVSFSTVARAEIWGSAKSKSYHLASCRYVKKTWKGYRVKFNSAADAGKAGYKPCEVCKPPKATLPGAKSKSSVPADG